MEDNFFFNDPSSKRKNEKKKDFTLNNSSRFPPDPDFTPPQQLETLPSTLDQFRKGASGFHFFDDFEEEEEKRRIEEEEEEEEKDENNKKEKKVKKFSFFERLQSIKKPLEEEEEEKEEEEELKGEEDLSYIPFTELDLSIHSPFAPTPPKGQHHATILHNEIVSLVNFMDETPQERSERQRIIDYFTQAVKKLFKSSRVSVFGSFRYQLMLPGSDIDLQIKIDRSKVRKGGKEKEIIINLLFDIQREFSILKKIRGGSKVIKAAKIPILQCQEETTGQPIDICIILEDRRQTFFNFRKKSKSKSKSISRDPAELNADLVLEFCRSCPAYRYLVLLLKLYLRQRCLNNVHFGGLSSFSLCLMVMSFFQHHDNVNGDPRQRKLVSLGVLLVDFFGLFGIYFNYRDVAIDVRGEGRFIRKRNIRQEHVRNREREEEKLYIVNPNDHHLIVSGGTTKMDLIRLAFKQSFHMLVAEKKYYRKTLGDRILPRIIRISEDLLRRGSYIKNQKRR